MSTNGIIQPREHISHDAVQGWINEATTGAGIPHGPGDNFTTHTYRRGGAQWRWMFAPIGQRWTLARVRWWGSWAENENVSAKLAYFMSTQPMFIELARYPDPLLARRAALIRE